MSDYLKLPIRTRLARYIKERDSVRVCGYPHPHGDGRYCLTPILKPDRNSRFESGSSTMLWVENFFGRSHRWCDQVYRYIKHTGWYIDSFQDETARGLVIRITGRNGKEQFMAAIADPFNYDRKSMNGPIMLCLDEVFDDEDECARRADSITEWYAESCREEDEKYQAEQAAEEEATESAEAQHWAERDVITLSP